jgi:predicted ATPase
VALLDENAIATYVTRRLPGLSCAESLAQLIQEQTEGNPLFMATLVEAWLTEGVLCEREAAWRLQRGGEAVHERIPDSLRQMIEGQLDRLGEEDQRMLEVASVVGVEFVAAAVAAGLGQTLERVDEACATLARRGLWLRAVGDQNWPDGTVSGGYRFSHALYRQVLYRRLAAARRAQLHQALGCSWRWDSALRATRGQRNGLYISSGDATTTRALCSILRQAGENAIR